MATTLVYGSTTITLHDDMLWVDEFDHRNAVQRTERTIAGSLIVETAAQVKGRPITLQAGRDYGWLARSELLKLQTAADLPGQQFTLTVRGTAYTVQFDHERGALAADPVIDYSDPDSTDKYVVTARFLEVQGA